MMAKIGIITLIGYSNFGNRLQNYALQEFIKSFGFSVDTIVFNGGGGQHTETSKKVIAANNKSVSLTNRFNNYIKRIGILTGLFYFPVLFIKTYLKRNNKKNRETIFKKFVAQNISEVRYGKLTNDYLNIENNYDYFIVGSDQVWNPHYIKGKDEYFLRFTSYNKRIAYSASFGVSAIPDHIKSEYKRHLSDISRISVREDTAAKIVFDLTGKIVPVLIDPTMLLTKSEWLSISNESRYKPKSKYMALLFLGGICEKRKNFIKKLAKDKKLIVIDLNSPNSKFYRNGPQEFLDIINSADIILTDSFHATVFSILFERPFIAFDRIHAVFSMNSRIDNLLKKFELAHRKYGNINEKDIYNIDFTLTNTILKDEREKAKEFIEEALGIN